MAPSGINKAFNFVESTGLGRPFLRELDTQQRMMVQVVLFRSVIITKLHIYGI